MVSSVQAAVPFIMDQQGILRNSTNSLLTGSYLFNVTYYNVSNNNQVYTEEKNIDVSSGVWNYIIGLGTSITPSIFKDRLYFNTSIGGEELGRTNFTTVPYSFHSYKANNTDYLGGQLPAYYLDDTDTNTYNTTTEMIAAVNGTKLNLSTAYGYTETDTAHNECSEIANCVDDAWDADGDIAADEISESKIAFSTACAAGDYYRLTGNDLECTTPTDTNTWNTSAEMIAATIQYDDWDADADIAADTISESKIIFSTACAAGDYYRLTGNDLECTTPTDTDTYNTTIQMIAAVNGTSLNITNTGTLDGYEAAALLDDTDTNCNSSASCAGGDVAYMDYANTGNFTSGDRLIVLGNNFRLGSTDADHYIYVFEDASASGEYIKWDDGDDRWELSDELLVDGPIKSSDWTNVSITEAQVSDADWWDADADIAVDTISESKIIFSTACAAGDYYRLTGNDLECTTPTDTNTWNTTAEMIAATIQYDDWDADADIGADAISESKIIFSTACAAGNHYYLNGNDLACEADDYNAAFDSEDEIEAAIFDGDNTANLGLTGYNISAIDCIIFDSGGKICSGS